MKSIKMLMLIASLLLTFVVKTNGQITSRNLIQKFAPEQVKAALIPQNRWKPFPQTGEQWRQQLPDSLVHSIIRKGEAALKKPFNNIPATVTLEFARTGNRTDYERLSFAKRLQLFDLVLAETVEDKGRFTDRIVDGVWSICEETFWGINAHIGEQKAGIGLPDAEEPIVDLFAAETAATLAWTDYFIGPKLEKVSKLVRPRIYYETNRRIFQPMLTAKYGWMGKGDPNAVLNNWAPWIASNYLTAGLILEKDETKRNDIVTRAIRLTDQYINGLGDDAGCDEGPGYWFAAGAAVFDVLNQLYDATGGKVTIYNEPFTQKMASYIYKVHIDGPYFITVADAHPEIVPDGILLYRYGKAVNDTRLAAFGSYSFNQLQHSNVSVGANMRTRTLYNLLAVKQVSAANEHYTDLADVWLSDVEMMISRTSNGLFVATHAGHNGESHNHNDVGDFVVYADGYPVIIDVGAGTYTRKTFGGERYSLWFNNSAYHNVPLINSLPQSAGKKFSATDVNYNITKSAADLKMNLKQAYPANADISEFKRDVKVIKSGKIEIVDNLKSVSPVKQLNQFFMTVCPVDLSHPGTIQFSLPNGKNVYLFYDASLFDASKEKVELTQPEDKGIQGNWHNKDIFRVTLSAKQLSNNMTLKYLIQK